MGLAEPGIFKEFTSKIESVKNELLSLLNRVEAEGKTIAGYGASATVTTLIYNFELGSHLSFLVDDNASRHCMFSPGHHLPVFPPETLSDRKPDYVIILAWQYAKPILQKNQRFLQNGGRFILPMPSVRLVDTVT